MRADIEQLCLEGFRRAEELQAFREREGRLRRSVCELKAEFNSFVMLLTNGRGVVIDNTENDVDDHPELDITSIISRMKAMKEEITRDSANHSGGNYTPSSFSEDGQGSNCHQMMDLEPCIGQSGATGASCNSSRRLRFEYSRVPRSSKLLP
jgi:hypothetical protein